MIMSALFAEVATIYCSKTVMDKINFPIIHRNRHMQIIAKYVHFEIICVIKFTNMSY